MSDTGDYGFTEDDFMGLLQMAAEEMEANDASDDDGDGLTDAESYVLYGSVVGKHGSPASRGSTQEQAFRDLLGGR
jgi:hypothetical protein